jgi:lipid A ethanolaminephosphotransferase
MNVRQLASFRFSFHFSRPTAWWLQARPISQELLALLVIVHFSLLCNSVLWQQVLVDRSWLEPGTWWFAACMGVGVTALQWGLLTLVLTHHTARWTLTVLLLATALAVHFMHTYHVFLDPDMLRNVIRTDVKEARELLSWHMLWDLVLLGGLPIYFLWRLPLRERSWPQAVVRRVGAVVLALGVCVAAVLMVFQDFAAMARNHREWRFLVTPLNAVYSLGRVGAASARSAAKPQVPIGTDARLGLSWALRDKPVLFVVIVGETARAANWGLNGYGRQTTPELARLGVLNFRDVTSCGTNTETSLPCMFSPWGRRDYDEARIRGHESLLHVLAHAGLQVLWRDNQSGCKGVCAGLPTQVSDPAQEVSRYPALCRGEHCFDQVLLEGLDDWLAAGRGKPQSGAQSVAAGSRVLVLHQLGSHGPAYYRRYPEEFRQFKPTCETNELHKCSEAEIVNAYDNSILYTDHVIAQTIRLLKRQASHYDTALVYVSDHGESLGERNLFLHGMPRAIAPREQTQVPMVMWMSPGFSAGLGLDTGCLRLRAAAPASHDNLFHSLLGFLDVQTGIYDRTQDLATGCRHPALTAVARN